MKAIINNINGNDAITVNDIIQFVINIAIKTPIIIVIERRSDVIDWFKP